MTGPGPAEAAARVAVRRALGDLPRGSLVLVACSGGADSLALAAATAFVAPRLGLRAGAVTVDHGLLAGSDDVARGAADACRGLGLDPVEVRAVVVSPAGSAGGPEAAAREARYAALEAAAREHGAAAVLLAHTLDDQAETVLLGLARGSGARSLAGMPAVRGLLRRPFLDLRRTDTEAVCAAARVDWWDDPTNGRDETPNLPGSLSVDAPGSTPRQFGARAGGVPLPLRSRVRTELLPELTRVLGPGVPAALARSAAQLRDDADLLDELAAELLDRARTAHGACTATGALDADVLAQAPRALRTRALRRAAVDAGSPAGDLAATHVDALDALVTRWRGQGAAHLPGPVLASRECGTLVLRPGRPAGRTPAPPPASRSLSVDRSDVAADLSDVLLTEEQLQARLDELAEQIDADYAGKDLLLVGVLKGAVMVMADLARRLHHSAQMDWMAVSSYGSGTKSSGVVRILKDLDADLTGRHVLIVEDIIDSGLTLSWLLSNLRSRGPASVEVAAMLRKPEASKVDVDVRYVGFDIPNEFVVGYGLDYAEKYRNLPFVGTLAPHVYGG